MGSEGGAVFGSPGVSMKAGVSPESLKRGGELARQIATAALEGLGGDETLLQQTVARNVSEAVTAADYGVIVGMTYQLSQILGAVLAGTDNPAKTIQTFNLIFALEAEGYFRGWPWRRPGFEDDPDDESGT